LVELSLFRYNAEALIFPEMYELIRGLGFRYYEDVGGWRSPVDGTTLQKDVLFVREDLFLKQGAGRSRNNGRREDESQSSHQREPAAVEG
jgi:hypothetical protein